MRYRPPARAIAITGFMGTGKTCVGRLLAARLGLDFVDTDEAIEAEAGLRIPAIFERYSEEHFRDLETAALARALEAGRSVISTGGGMLLREGNVKLLRCAGPIVCLTATAECILQRTAGDAGRPLLQVPDPARRIAELLSEREEAYARADYHVATTDLTQAEVVERVVEALREDPRARWYLGGRAVVPVALKDSPYQVIVGRGLLTHVGTLYPPRQRGVCAAVVTTDVVAPLFAEQVMASLRAGGWEARLLVVPDGEASKSLAVVSELWDQMAEAGLDRGSTVFALGGGVVGDLAGFAAAAYMRGIDLVHLPTTLLAQVDSSIGGKAAIDLSAGKNLVGAFHQPRAVITDVAALRTLPAAELRSGLGEVIKHACCFDAELFEFLEHERESVLSANGPALEYLVARNCQIKAEVVREDPHERGLRTTLNYGHTVGHALERAAPGWELRHGEVVGAGMVAEARIAVWAGICAPEVAERQERLIAAYGLPTWVHGVDEAAALRALERDKKIVAGRLRLPLVPEIGSVRIIEDVDIDLVCRALRSVLR
ncbi:MAG: 3-dehydroquinate synthase [Armatimonadota bacterium]